MWDLISLRYRNSIKKLIHYEVHFSTKVSDNYLSNIHTAELWRNTQKESVREKKKYMSNNFSWSFEPWKINFTFRTPSTILRRFIELKVSYSGRRNFQEENFHSSCCKSNQGPQELGGSQILEAKCLACSCCWWEKNPRRHTQTYA